MLENFLRDRATIERLLGNDRPSLALGPASHRRTLRGWADTLPAEHLEESGSVLR